MHVFCDFDGTISIEDATDYILSRFADPEWESIEDEWKRGLIGSAECMQRQVALIRTPRQALDQALDEIAIDRGFPEFVAFCRSIHIPVTVISDGVDYFIERILKRHHLDDLPVIANKLSVSGVNGHTQYQLSSPYRMAQCAAASGVCKCRAVSSYDMRIYVGDGRSDFCVSDKPDIVFAKGKLAEYCERRQIEFVPYHSFTDVTHTLKRLLPGILRRESTAFEHAIA